MAIPHCSIEDFVYNGMYIPKNTVVILNCYDIHHNEEKYPDSYGPFTLDYTRADASYPQFFVQPRSLHGRYADVYRIEQTPQRHGSGPLGVRRGVSIFTLDLVKHHQC
jgi:cytochrome P450